MRLIIRSSILTPTPLVRPQCQGLPGAIGPRAGERVMGRINLQEFITIAKEGLDRSFLVAKFLCFLHVTNTYLCAPVTTQGPSMLPTFSLMGDLVLTKRVSTLFGQVGTGDIVLVRSPENPRKVVIKRVKGMEGDSVTYVVDPKNSDARQTVVVPKGHVWIEGDNIYNSYDSRNFGVVPYGLIQSKVFWRIWPREGFGSLG